jgi:hypothetical protein
LAAIVGGCAGVISGLVVVGLAALSGGDLGVLRLVGLGPLLLSLLVLAPAIMGLSGLLAAALAGLHTYRRQCPPAEKMSAELVSSATLVEGEMFPPSDNAGDKE